MGNEPKRRGQDPVTNKKRRNEINLGINHKTVGTKSYNNNTQYINLYFK